MLLKFNNFIIFIRKRKVAIIRIKNSSYMAEKIKNCKKKKELCPKNIKKSN